MILPNIVLFPTRKDPLKSIEYQNVIAYGEIAVIVESQLISKFSKFTLWNRNNFIYNRKKNKFEIILKDGLLFEKYIVITVMFETSKARTGRCFNVFFCFFYWNKKNEFIYELERPSGFVKKLRPKFDIGK